MATTTKEETKREETKREESKKEEAKHEPKVEVKETRTETRTVDAISRTGRAEAIIRRNVLWSLGAGIIPVPILDAVAVTGVQIKMLAELSKLYDVTFSEDVGKKLIGSLITGLGGTTLGVLLGSSVAKAIPFVGTALGIVTAPVIVGAFTLATGKVFMMHFESGGTLLDFDPHKMRAHFKAEFEKAKETVTRIKEEHTKTTSTAA